MATLRQYRDLLPQAERLFGSDSGTTGAPMRSLLTLVAGCVLVVIGAVLVVKGAGWLRRVRLPQEGAAAIDRDEVVTTLRQHQLLAYGDGPAATYWLLRRWLAVELADLTWWRREIASEGVRAFVRSCGLVVVLTVGWLALSQIMADDPLGPFPLTFVIMLPFVTAIWAALGLLVIGSVSPRAESVTLSLPAGEEHRRGSPVQQIIETRPDGPEWEPPGLGLMLGAAGVAVQCLMLWWWDLSLIDYPLRATTILRHAGAIAGGTIFFVVGGRMVAAAAKLLLLCRYRSMLVLIDADGHEMVARAAEVRTESFGPAGSRHVVAAAGGAHVRESAANLIRERAHPGLAEE